VGLELAVNVGADHAEGPFWSTLDQRLWWVDITGHRVHCFNPTSGEDQSWNVGTDVGAVIATTRGDFLLALPGGIVTFDAITGSVDPLVDLESDMPENRGNDATCDSTGRLWVGTMAYDRRPDHGALYSVDRDLVVRRVVSGITIANGPAFDEARGWMYVADTGVGIVYRFGVDISTGEVSDQSEVFADLSNIGWPDGMTVDNDGFLWLAVGRDSSVHRYSPTGVLDGKIDLPVTNPTSVAFGGSEALSLFITTSLYDVAPRDRASQPLAGSIFVDHPGVGGPPSAPFVCS
jgi:sugar lactone lactonase YvrE